MTVHLLSWLGCFLLLYGLKLIGDKKLAGFYVAIIGELFWILWAVLTQAWAMLAMSIWIVGMYVRAVWLWKKDQIQVKSQ